MGGRGRPNTDVGGICVFVNMFDGTLVGVVNGDGGCVGSECEDIGVVQCGRGGRFCGRGGYDGIVES